MQSHLLKLLTDPRFDEYLGRRACFKLAVLAHQISGEGTLAGVARKYGVTRQAAFKHATDAKRIFCEGKPTL